MALGAKDSGKPSVFKSFHLLPILFIFFICAIMLPAPSFAGPDEPETRTVDAQGFSTISGDNDVIARDGAIADALRKAVEQAVGTMVSSETMVENYQVLSDSVYTNTQGYVKSYTVIGESKTPALYQVNVRAVVAIGTIKNDLDALGLLHVKAEKPRVLFMIAEQNVGDKYYTFWWWGKREFMGETVDMSAAETSLKELFLSKGFNVVDISGSMDTLDISNAFKVADLTNDGARQIGRKVNAEVVIKGKALAKEGARTPGSQVAAYIADITAQAIRVDTGEVLASTRGHGVARNISEVTGGTEALSRASTELGDKLIDQIVAKWTKGNQVTIRISGITDYKKVANIKNALKKQVRGVSAVYQRRFEGGLAVFELDTKTSAQTIADEMASISGLRLRVTNTTQNTIDAVLE